MGKHVKWAVPNLIYYPGILMESLRKNGEKAQDSRYSSRYFTTSSPKCELETISP
jgi:hypothetical protein